jgi:Holliday junction resolvasome RuvABC endonuclease subunit
MATSTGFKRSSIKKSSRYLYIMGLDPSLSGTGMFISDKSGKDAVSGLFSSDPKQRIEDRLLTLWLEIEQHITINRNRLSLVVLEGLAFGSKGQRREQLSGLHYFIRTMIRKCYPDIPVAVVPASEIKKFVSGSGRANKEQMVLNCYKKWQFENADNNIIDSYCIVKYAFSNMARLMKQTEKGAL